MFVCILVVIFFVNVVLVCLWVFVMVVVLLSCIVLFGVI